MNTDKPMMRELMWSNRCREMHRAAVIIRSNDWSWRYDETTGEIEITRETSTGSVSYTGQTEFGHLPIEVLTPGGDYCGTIYVGYSPRTGLVVVRIETVLP